MLSAKKAIERKKRKLGDITENHDTPQLQESNNEPTIPTINANREIFQQIHSIKCRRLEGKIHQIDKDLKRVLKKALAFEMQKAVKNLKFERESIVRLKEKIEKEFAGDDVEVPQPLTKSLRKHSSRVDSMEQKISLLKV